VLQKSEKKNAETYQLFVIHFNNKQLAREIVE
jgi:hypothetical protein